MRVPLLGIHIIRQSKLDEKIKAEVAATIPGKMMSGMLEENTLLKGRIIKLEQKYGIRK